MATEKTMFQENLYNESSIKTLDWNDHIRLRPGMYIGKLGDGNSPDDGIYVLLKEIVDNSIDEFVMNFGKKIEIKIEDKNLSIRDYGRGIPLGKLVDVVSKINTSGKFDSLAFQKSVGLNGVGIKAVNALSSHFVIESIRDGKEKKAEFARGILIKEHKETNTNKANGVEVLFVADDTIFKNYAYQNEYVEKQIWNYCFLNTGLTFYYNNKEFISKNGLSDLLNTKINPDDVKYPIVHLKSKDIEIVFTHNDDYGEELYSFVNGQYTTQGGTHQQAFRESFVKVVKDFFKKDWEAADIRQSIVAAISVRIKEPVFESQTKTKLGSHQVEQSEGNLVSMKNFIITFLEKELDDFLHKNNTVAEALRKRIEQSERERKELSGIKKLANERAKKANLHNKKLRDCRIHLNDEIPNQKTKNEFQLKQQQSTIFITEGDSASGSITKARNVETQAVFSLKGKPLNCVGQTKKIVYENEEFNLLQHALNVEDGLEGLRFNNIVIATDADNDGMHIRLLLSAFFLQFFPDIIKNRHIYILETPLFRVRNKQKTMYCYSEKEKQNAILELSGKPEITRFKGLGEISPDEFKNFIGDNIRLQPFLLSNETNIHQLLEEYLGTNTKERQEFLMNNLIIEKDIVEVL